MRPADSDASTRPQRRSRAPRRTWVLLAILLAGVLIMGAAFVAVARATDAPSFCATCHEMKPFVAAWEHGTHSQTACVECHVDPGIARLTHKFVALGEVISHLRGNYSFPLATPPNVPDARCARCHPLVTVSIPGFSHDEHEQRGACTMCHMNAGHAVTTADLVAAGIYSGRSLPSTGTAGATSIDGGMADLAGHITVACSRCHVMSKIPCSSCHTASAAHKGRPKDCSLCHAPGSKFVFTHPVNRTDCATCHTAPASHVTRPTNCAICHQVGAAFVFTHPTARTDCTACHTAPASHAGRSTDCAICHAVGTAFVFIHPTGRTDCVTCHPARASHTGRSTDCAVCHKVGPAWVFTHPSRADCASCHAAPANHYGTSCVSCHTPSRPWASATFTHGAIPGGEHTYRSFACVNCHPNGYSTYTCAACHDSATGPSEED
ncbi:MAG: hypothetical protein HGA39_03775 [Coriobacteriia bacterium]|nr:hypothetical protein [Coriobacteriia bacterium]